MEERKILCVDLKSFYASVECADAGLDIFEVPLVVADRTRGNGGITLAVTPFLKQKGVPSRCRVYELPKEEDIIFAKPRMKRYIDVSTSIVSIYLDYVSEDDLHIYSIDEAFLDVTNYLNYHKQNALELAHTIQKDIYSKTKIRSTCGIGPNMLMAKLALDLDSKKSKTGIAYWTYDDIEARLWPVEPLSKVWGIGVKLEARLNELGIYNVYDLAHSSLDLLIDKFGVYGEQLYYHSHGIDHSDLKKKHDYVPKSTSIGHGQTLYFDHFEYNVKQIILELADRVAKRMRKKQVVGTVVHLGIMYSKKTPGGFSRQKSIKHPTDSPLRLYDVCLLLFNEYYDGRPIRKVSISVGKLTPNTKVQMDLFGLQNNLDKERNLLNAVDKIQECYGKNAILRATHFKDSSTMIERNDLIGGHRA